jgi:hypothetical protein
MRKEFELTQPQLDELLNASKSTPVMYLYAWEKLSTELGFKHMTVRPNGKGNRFFTAMTVENKSILDNEK